MYIGVPAPSVSGWSRSITTNPGITTALTLACQNLPRNLHGGVNLTAALLLRGFMVSWGRVYPGSKEVWLIYLEMAHIDLIIPISRYGRKIWVSYGNAMVHRHRWCRRKFFEQQNEFLIYWNHPVLLGQRHRIRPLTSTRSRQVSKFATL